ncbi:hypothetical protein HDG32_001085 [Paraburkholderia sp. CI2]|uniref:hypothetical protein n=1 Tax=Paraburkholderia sp. CI2 TaxID=2723093 RepID=UPI0016082FA2|nr:hypothetical protein [Paraburkholderia sp. CI2]MBB5464991.1 hypothetical protein [Paraburkholderia sp. CI2]
MTSSLSQASTDLCAVRAAENLRGVALLHNPHANKSTAFTVAEREQLGLVGLLPEQVETEEAHAPHTVSLLISAQV